MPIFLRENFVSVFISDFFLPCLISPQVKDQEFPYRKNLARVLIEVEDINDHVPIFTSALYEGQVYESAAVGSAVVQVTALDKDKGANAELHYSIEAGEHPCQRDTWSS